MIQELLFHDYVAPECHEIEFGPGEIICISENGTLDGFDPVNDGNFFN